MSLHRNTSLRDALGQWVQEGILSKENAQILSERYQLEAEAPWYRNVSFLVSVVAVVLVSMGFVLGISQNWDHLSVPWRVASGAIPWLLAIGITVWASISERSRLAETWGLLACLIYGTNIFLQAQIFHISGYAPTGVMWWMIGSIPFAILLRSHVITFLVQALAVTWIGLESEFEQFSPLVFPLGAFVLLIAHQRVGRFTLIGTMAVIIWMIHHARGPLYEVGGPTEILTALVASGTVAMAFLAVATKVEPSFRDKAAYAGMVIILFNAFIASSTMGTDALVVGQGDWYATFLIAVAVPVLLWANRSPLSWLAAAIAVWFGIGTMLPVSNVFNSVFTYGLNVIIFGGAVYLVYVGVKSQHKAWFMSGLVLIVVHAIVRYFDLFSDYLVSSLIFVLAGVGLVLANRFWTRRFNA